ncbi:MAG: hypothetical protein M3Y09_08760 [Actinomycetota bacterium]|nr:hypothetical protein [Actinomycetota bacterium]
MSTPEDALDRAREALRAQRAAGRYPDPPAPDPPPSPADARRKLLEWAFIEPGAEVLRSTRRYGAPITAFKRLLYRALAQHLDVVVANQARFNLALLADLERIEARIEALEDEQDP